MPYPFVRAPTYSDFVDVAKRHGAVLHQTATAAAEGLAITTLVREVDGVTLTLDIIGDWEASTVRLAPNVLRSMCARLKIPISEFGYNLG